MRIKVVGGTILAAALLVGLLIANSRSGSRPARPAGSPRPSSAPLVLYCAAGMQPAVAAVVKAYESEFGVPVQVQYGGSGTLLANLRVAGVGDLYLAGDRSYIDIGREQDLLAEVIPLAALRPVIAVRAGNPHAIAAPADLARPGLRLALANPDAAAVGKLARAALERHGLWDRVAAAVRERGVFKPTVNDIANDIRIGTVDAGIIWDATARQFPDLQIAAGFDDAADLVSEVAVAVLRGCSRPAAALHLARYLAAPEKGQPAFSQHGFAPLPNDPWADVPEIVLLSGGVNRPAIEQTLREFEAREGCRVLRVYNGCGILVAQMKAGERPDAYFACDVSFMDAVRDLFLDPLDVSATDIVIAVPAGNPRGIGSLADLTAEGLKLGVANARQSALGDLTERLLQRLGLLEGVMRNVRSQTPTADLLVNQLRTGTLDAVIVYAANLSQVRAHLDAVRIDSPAAHAVQPFAVGRASRHPRLTTRLLEAICSAESRRRYGEAGFQWLVPAAPPAAPSGTAD